MIQWLDAFLNHTFHDELLSWALKSKDMRLADTQAFTSEERVTTVLAAQSARHALNIAFEVPFTGVNFALAATTGILLADLVARNAHMQLLMGDMVLITRQVGIGVDELSHLKLGKIDIGRIWHIQSALRKTQPRDTENPRVFVAAPQPGKLADIAAKVDSVVIDATHPLTLERLDVIMATPLVQGARRVALILPLGYQARFLDDGWVLWAWDFKTMNACRQSLKGEQTRWLEGWHRTFIVSNDKVTDELLARAREKLSLLSRHTGHTPPTELQIAWGIYSKLSNLCVPLRLFEDTALRQFYARTIRERIEQITEFNYADVPTSSHAIWASEWRPLLESLQKVYQNLKGEYPTKFWSLALLIDERIRKGFNKPLLIVCPTQTEGNILIRELGKTIDRVHEFLHPEGLIFVTPRNLAEFQERWKCEIVCTGSMTSRWRYLNAALTEITIVAYPHELRGEQSNLNKQVHLVSEASSTVAKIEVLTKLKLCKDIDDNTVELGTQASVEFTTIYPEGIPERHSYPAGDQMELDSLMSPSWAWDATDLEYVSPILFSRQDQIGNQQDANGPLIIGPRAKLSLSNGETWLVPGEQVFDVFRIVTEELEELPATELQVGDILIIVDDSSFGRLFERITEALEQRPDFALLGVWLNIWGLVKQSALERHANSFSNLQSDLESAGFSITEQAVRSWFRGIVGPRDEEMIFAIIDISQFKSALEHKSQIRSSIGHMRGMHRAVGRRIRSMVRQTAMGNETRLDINDAVNIAVEDVVSAAIRVTVQDIVIFED